MQNLFQEMLLDIIREWNETCRLTERDELLLEYKDQIGNSHVQVEINFKSSTENLVRETMSMNMEEIALTNVPIQYVANEMLQQACKRCMTSLVHLGFSRVMQIMKERELIKVSDYPGINGISFKLEIKRDDNS